MIHDKGGRTGHSGESKLNTFLSPLVGAESALALSGGMGEAEGDEGHDEAGKSEYMEAALILLSHS